MYARMPGPPRPAPGNPNRPAAPATARRLRCPWRLKPFRVRRARPRRAPDARPRPTRGAPDRRPRPRPAAARADPRRTGHALLWRRRTIKSCNNHCLAALLALERVYPPQLSFSLSSRSLNSHHLSLAHANVSALMCGLVLGALQHRRDARTVWGKRYTRLCTSDP